MSFGILVAYAFNSKSGVRPGGDKGCLSQLQSFCKRPHIFISICLRAYLGRSST